MKPVWMHGITTHDQKKKFGVVRIGRDTEGLLWLLQYNYMRVGKLGYCLIELYKEQDQNFVQVFVVEGGPFKKDHDEAVLRLLGDNIPGTITEEQVRECISNYEFPL